MASQAYNELLYRLWKNYITNLKENEVVEFNWEKELPVGRSRFEHNNKACRLLADIIEEHSYNPRTSVLIGSRELHLILGVSSEFEPTPADWFGAAYECGTLHGTPIVVTPGLEGLETMWLIDLYHNKVIKIKQGKYDYAADKKKLLADQGVVLEEKE